MKWKKICSLDDIVPDTGVCAQIDDKHIALFRLAATDEVLAIDNIDPFSRSSVLSRGLIGSVGGTPTVASPLHKQRFDLRSGHCLDDESITLTTYATRISKDAVSISLA